MKKQKPSKMKLADKLTMD